MKNETKKGRCGRGLGWAVVVLSLVLLFGGSDFSLAYGSTVLLDANSLTAITLLILGIISLKLSK